MRALILPAVALALPQAAILARVLRSALIEELGRDYIRTARAKGASRGHALRRHALRNALIPVLTILGMQFSFLLAGAIIIENVFALPGLGRLIFQAITQRDLIVVESVVMLLVFAVDRGDLRHRSGLCRGRPAAEAPRMRAPLALGAVLSAAALTAALVSLVWTPWDPGAMAISARLQPPSPAHWAGTDHFGRDIASHADGGGTDLACGRAGRGGHRHGRGRAPRPDRGGASRQLA